MGKISVRTIFEAILHFIADLLRELVVDLVIDGLAKIVRFILRLLKLAMDATFGRPFKRWRKSREAKAETGKDGHLPVIRNPDNR